MGIADKRDPQFKPKRGVAQAVSRVTATEPGLRATKAMLLELIALFDTEVAAAIAEIERALGAVALKGVDETFVADLHTLPPSNVAAPRALSYTGYLYARSRGTAAANRLVATFEDKAYSPWGNAALMLVHTLQELRAEGQRLRKLADRVPDDDPLIEMGVDFIGSARVYTEKARRIGTYAGDDALLAEAASYKGSERDAQAAIVAGSSAHAESLKRNLARVRALAAVGGNAIYGAYTSKKPAKAEGAQYGFISELVEQYQTKTAALVAEATSEFTRRNEMLFEAADKVLRDVAALRMAQVANQALATAGGAAEGVVSPVVHTDPDYEADEQLRDVAGIVGGDGEAASVQTELGAIEDLFVAYQDFLSLKELLFWGDTTDIDGGNIRTGTIQAGAIVVGDRPMQLDLVWGKDQTTVGVDQAIAEGHLSHSDGRAILTYDDELVTFDIAAAEVLTPSGGSLADADQYWIYLVLDVDAGTAHVAADTTRPDGEDIVRIGIWDSTAYPGRLMTSYGMTIVNGNEVITGTLTANRIVVDNGNDLQSELSTAQDTADGKRRVFTGTPVAPYDVGDLWAPGSGGDLKRCSRAKTGPLSARYIRDWSAGAAPTTTSNHWMEIEAIAGGQNVALNKTVSFMPGTTSENGAYTVNGVKDNTSQWARITAPTGQPVWVQVDLGQAYDLTQVNVWHRYGDNRVYAGTKTEVSSDGVNWITIFDSAVSGTYAEAAGGHLMLLGYESGDWEIATRDYAALTDAKPNVTYGTTAPPNPRVNDIWIDSSPRVTGSIAKLDRSSNVVTITTAASHGLSAGQIISVDAVDNTFDATDVPILSIPSGTKFTFAQTAANVTEKVDAGTWSATSLRLTKVWSGSAWIPSVDVFYPGKTTINGSLLETGTVIADRAVVGIDLQSPVVRSGKTAYANANTGFWLGLDAATPKLDIGSSTKYLRWDGTDLSVVGGTISGSSFITSGEGARLEISSAPANFQYVKFYNDGGSAAYLEGGGNAPNCYISIGNGQSSVLCGNGASGMYPKVYLSSGTGAYLRIGDDGSGYANEISGDTYVGDRLTMDGQCVIKGYSSFLEVRNAADSGWGGAKVELLGVNGRYLVKDTLSSNVYALGIRNWADSAYADIRYQTAYPMSARHLKQDIAPTGIAALPTILGVEPKKYKFKDNVERSGEDAPTLYGFILDELPEFLQYGEGINDTALIAVVWQAIRELAAFVKYKP